MRAGPSAISTSISSAQSSTAQARRSERSAVSPQWLPVLSAASVHTAAGAEDGPSKQPALSPPDYTYDYTYDYHPPPPPPPPPPLSAVWCVPALQ